LRYVPLDRPGPRRTRAQFDLPGLALMGTGLITGMLAATYLGDADARLWSGAFLIPLCIALVTLALFVRHINRSPHPFIAPRLVHGSDFGIINSVNIIYGGATGGVMVLVPLYAINRYGMSALDSGTLLISQGLAAILFASIAAF